MLKESASTSHSFPNLVEELWQSSAQGIPEGETLHVPMGCCAVILVAGEVRYMLNPQSYLMAQHIFPELSPLKVARGARPRLRGAAYLVRTADIILPWEQPIVGAGRWNEGAACEMVAGRYSLRVTDPARFLQTVYRQLRKEHLETDNAQSFRLSMPRTDAQRFAGTELANGANGVAMPALFDALSAMQQDLKRQKASIAQNPQAVQAEVARRVAARLQLYGIHMIALSVDRVLPPAPMPCSSCGTVQRPTGYVNFFSNASFLYIRYTWTQKGHLCLLCALKSFLLYTTIILFLGWWGFIGLLFSPVLLGLNLVNICRALLRYRMPALPPGSGQANRP